MIQQKKFCGVYYPTSCRVIIQLTNICAKFSKFYGQTFEIFDETLDLMRPKFGPPKQKILAPPLAPKHKTQEALCPPLVF